MLFVWILFFFHFCTSLSEFLHNLIILITVIYFLISVTKLSIYGDDKRLSRLRYLRKKEKKKCST